ncbi:MAG: hypothetical protein E6G94_15410 [Alphaproteobacteria bacterium]|nr:MAG: hypothetical protein E6G94_15410 [Alphaproteobacteria bacterium]
MTPLPSNIAELQDLVKRIQEDADAVRTEARDKVKSDRQRLKDKMGERKEAYRAFFADANDEDRRLGAAIAVDYAIATVQQARLAVLDAVSDRAEARQSQAQPVS